MKNISLHQTFGAANIKQYGLFTLYVNVDDWTDKQMLSNGHYRNNSFGFTTIPKENRGNLIKSSVVCINYYPPLESAVSDLEKTLKKLGIDPKIINEFCSDASKL